MVFDTRARSNAVVVGGNTVRRDDPRLTTRREGGHQPTRIVMTQKLDLPEVAGLGCLPSSAHFGADEHLAASTCRPPGTLPTVALKSLDVALFQSSCFSLPV